MTAFRKADERSMNAAERAVSAQLLALGLPLQIEDIRTVAQNPEILNYGSARHSRMSDAWRHRTQLQLEVSRVARLYRLVDGCVGLWLTRRIGVNRLCYWNSMDDVIRRVLVDCQARKHFPPQHQRDLIDDLAWRREWCGSTGRETPMTGWKAALRAELRSVPLSASVIERRCAALVGVDQLVKDWCQNCVHPVLNAKGDADEWARDGVLELWGRIFRSSLGGYVIWHSCAGDVLGFNTEKLLRFEVYLRNSGIQWVSGFWCGSLARARLDLVSQTGFWC